MSTDNRLPITESFIYEIDVYKDTKGKYNCNIKNNDGKIVAQTFGKSPEEVRANAQLIADAGTTYNKCHTLPSQLLEILEEINNDYELWEKLSTKYQSKIYSAITPHS